MSTRLRTISTACAAAMLAALTTIATAGPASAASFDRRVHQGKVSYNDGEDRFCARADDRASSSVWTPATGRHGDLVVGVHGGGDPQRAIAVRDELRAVQGQGGSIDLRELTPNDTGWAPARSSAS